MRRAGVGIFAGLFAAAALACSGSEQSVGTIVGPGREAASVDRKAIAQQEAYRGLATSSLSVARHEKSILFGDLHVHTTYSIDAFLYSLPFYGGEGVHPPADACDFARHCANLDFFSLNDHAEGLTAERWRRSIESLRECNARAGSPDDPDLVAFLGWEWTQMGLTPNEHFGHKNVIVPGLADDEIPPRPISALADDVRDRARFLWLARIVEAATAIGGGPYADFLWWLRQLNAAPMCEPGVDSRELPPDCHENAPTPEVLFEKLAQWGGESLVIPHGLTWGVHAPRGARLDAQLRADRIAPERQRLLEVYSGHGSAERFEPVAARAQDSGLAGTCAPPSRSYLPCCWRAGEIIRGRCDDPESAACKERVVEARKLALEAGRRPHLVIPDTDVADWLDCDQTRDAFKPTLASRPHMSAQYGLALGGFDPDRPDAAPARLRFGLIGSSDNHTARAGSGYKQVHRKGMTDARGITSPSAEGWLRPYAIGDQEDPERAQFSAPEQMGFRSLLDAERGASFFYPGGLVGLHAAGRDRRNIWQALERREVYGTSGPRILLWFDLLNGPEGPLPMGGEIALSDTPSFEVRAVGSLEQRPGCPEETRAALSNERLERLCLGECYYPSEQRVPIEWIEVVRIRPQTRAGEPVEDLIDDPWASIRCPVDPNGCVVRFADPDFRELGRDTVYYVRALQERTPAINGGGARVRRGADGQEIARPCYGGPGTDRDDDCLAPVRERAWSSPIFVDYLPGETPPAEPDEFSPPEGFPGAVSETES